MSTRSWHRRILRAFRGRENGQIVILAAFFLVIGLSFAAIVIDVGRFMHGRQLVQNAVDAAALAAAQELPDHGSTAQTIANQYLDGNDPGLDPAQKSITFRCIVGDRDHNGLPDATDIPAVCNPGAGAHFTCHTGSWICVSPCNVSTPGNKCNTVVVGATKDVPFFIAPIFGMFQASTGNVRAAACRGACGGPPTIPLDLVIILDRTYSMSTQDIDKARAAAKSVLTLFDPSRQHVALGVLPQSKTSNRYQSVDNVNMNDPGVGNWVPVGLSADYQNPDKTLKTSSLLVDTITNLQRAPNPMNLKPDADCSSGGSDWCRQTDLADTVSKAAAYLVANGRPDVKKGIILLTDGEANQPRAGRQACLHASNEAAAAKAGANGIEIFTIGFGIGGATCEDLSPSPWRSGLSPQHNIATQLLADMATDSLDDHGHCTNSTNMAAENADGDHFLCEAKTGDLAALFQQAAAVLASGARLIQVPD
jgi:hypothetical protein